MSGELAARERALARVQSEIRACRRCVAAGFIVAAQPVFRGNAGQRLMVIGQAPGAPRGEQPVPFSGASGKTLDSWLMAAGFPAGALHERCYLTSLTKCFPGPSPHGQGDRPPSATEIELCHGWLDRELALVRPELVLSLGRLAATVLIGPAPLRELVGTLRPAERAGHRFLVLPLPHPSGVSRWLNEPANHALLARALALLADYRVEHGL